MKRSMGGGGHRAPVQHSRQRRTIRFMQGVLVLIAVGLFAFGVYSAVADPAAPDEFSPARSPGLGQVIVPFVLGLAALAGALYLGGREGARVPTPARLEELAGRAESVVAEKVRELADDERSATADEAVSGEPQDR